MLDSRVKHQSISPFEARRRELELADAISGVWVHARLKEDKLRPHLLEQIRQMPAHSRQVFLVTGPDWQVL